VTPTHALPATSPAVNKGVNCPSTDQRGIARPQGDQCDVGAYELEGSAPGAFSQVSPANGTTISTFVFTWTASSGAAEYKLSIQNPAGEKIVSEKLPAASLTCSPDCSTTATADFKPGKTYTWKLVAKNPFGKVKTEKRTFNVQG
jgi:hypothetical protein